MMPLRNLPEEAQKRYIQRHHLARKKADTFIVPLCPNCHELLDLKQYEWGVEAQHPLSPRAKRASFLFGLADLLDARAKVDPKIARRLRKFAEDELHDPA
jgi:hypothetical protein